MRPKPFVVIRPPIELRHSGRSRATGDGRAPQFIYSPESCRLTAHDGHLLVASGSRRCCSVLEQEPIPCRPASSRLRISMRAHGAASFLGTQSPERPRERYDPRQP